MVGLPAYLVTKGGTVGTTSAIADALGRLYDVIADGPPGVAARSRTGQRGDVLVPGSPATSARWQQPLAPASVRRSGVRRRGFRRRCLCRHQRRRHGHPRLLCRFHVRRMADPGRQARAKHQADQYRTAQTPSTTEIPTRSFMRPKRRRGVAVARAMHSQAHDRHSASPARCSHGVADTTTAGGGLMHRCATMLALLALGVPGGIAVAQTTGTVDAYPSAYGDPAIDPACGVMPRISGPSARQTDVPRKWPASRECPPAARAGAARSALCSMPVIKILPKFSLVNGLGDVPHGWRTANAHWRNFPGCPQPSKTPS